MGEMSGSNQTDAGAIPEGWQVRSVGTMGEVCAGKALAAYGPGTLRPYLRTKNVLDGRIVLDDVLQMPMTDADFARYRLRYGDVLLNEGQSIELVGRCAMYRDEYPVPCAIQNQLVRFRANRSTSAEFATHLFRSCQRRGVFSGIAMQTTSVAHLGVSRFHALLLAWPSSKVEQDAIAVALDDADRLIDALQRLITKKVGIKQAVMQQLLTGRHRLSGFAEPWREVAIAEIAVPTSEKNRAGDSLPVLTCSKHLGFVDSLRYFKNQVYSEDTSTYKIIRFGQIGYPANHVEEGSIGYQDLYERALVSPIYVTFSVKAGVNPYFLHRQLKLDTYRQKFEVATSASVDRRGSLRWPAFAKITVGLPLPAEQDAIAGILSDIEAEIALLEARLAHVHRIKQGMVQCLMSGKIRLGASDWTQIEARSAPSMSKKTGHNRQINEAVVISVLAKNFGTEQYPLGRMRYTKLCYLLHRHVERKNRGVREEGCWSVQPQHTLWRPGEDRAGEWLRAGAS